MEYIEKPEGVRITVTTQNIIADSPMAAVLLANNAVEAARRALNDPISIDPREMEDAILLLHRTVTTLERSLVERFRNRAAVPPNGDDDHG